MATIIFKCPNCGGELTFHPEKQNYKCVYCGSEFTQSQLEELTPMQGNETQDEEAAAGAVPPPGPEGAFETAQAGADTGSEDAGAGSSDTASGQAKPSGGGQAVVYTCPSCGAQIVTDATTAATFCYYCHNPVVLEGRVSGEFLPDRIIPFAIGEKQAKDKLKEYIKKKKYVPKAFTEESQIEKMTGVYYPYWVYDCSVNGQFQADATKVRMWRDSRKEYTETSVYQVERKGEVDIHRMTRNALRKTNRELVENVQPFSLGELQPFSMGYLSGFVAEKRDIEQKDFSQELQKEASGYAQQILKGTANGYATLNMHSSNYRITKEDWNYCLLPVWVLTYRSLGKLYYFAMNGQTGAIAGKLPVDGKKLGLHCGILGIIVMVLVLIGGYLL